MQYYKKTRDSVVGGWIWIPMTKLPIARKYAIGKRVRQFIKIYPYMIYPTFCPDCDKEWIRSDGKGRYNEEWCRECHYKQ